MRRQTSLLLAAATLAACASPEPTSSPVARTGRSIDSGLLAVSIEALGLE